MTRRVEFGDWQTPIELAEAAVARVAATGCSPAVVLETTCGEGTFLVAAERRFKNARLLGYELCSRYVATARTRARRAEIKTADFFGVDWERELANVSGHVLVLGNPPWVTSATLGTLGSRNLPEKRNLKGLSGLDAMTGKSNFDVSEWMILRLLAAFQGRRATIAILAKTAVARKVIEFATVNEWDIGPGGLWRIDTMRHFNAAVDAVLFVCEIGASRRVVDWPIYSSLAATSKESTMRVIDGVVVADVDGYRRTSHLVGQSEPEWRSGLKHDCSTVMELRRVGCGWQNAMGEAVLIEDALVYPLLKSSDVAKGRPASARGVVVPQSFLGEETVGLKLRAPRAWEYLSQHRSLLAARKSSIYRSQPAFAIFGIGPYSFAPWKVAISGLYKKCSFALVGPSSGRPVMLDDTCYFLPFEHEEGARQAHAALQSPLAVDFFTARVFWDAKRPITKTVLQSLDLQALLSALGMPAGRRRPKQQRLAV